MFEVSPDSLCSVPEGQNCDYNHRSQSLVGFAAVVVFFLGCKKIMTVRQTGRNVLLIVADDLNCALGLLW